MKGKRYRDCMAEIMGVLKKYDMAGAITVVDKERCMFKYHFPTWSVATVDLKGVRLKSKREDFPSIEAQREASELTAHCIMQIQDTAVNTLNMTTVMASHMREKWGMEHVPNADYDPEYDN